MTIERQKNRKGGKRVKDYRESKSLFNAFMKRHLEINNLWYLL